MAVTGAKFLCNPRRSLVLFGAFATKPSMAWAVRLQSASLSGPSRLMSLLVPCRLMTSVHLSTMHSGYEHGRTACTGCGPGA
eukprot:scaffold30110_cov70-Phaeocystis_antarctica.AAC.2